MNTENSTPNTTSAPAEASANSGDDRDEVYFEGSPALRGWLGSFTFCVVVGLGTAIGGMALQSYAWWLPLAGLLICALLLIIPVLLARSMRYKITNYRIDYERGLFSKDIDTLELWHVEDIKYHQSFMDRLLGIGQITVLPHDETTPFLLLRALPNPRPVFEALKQRIIAVKRQRGVIKIDAG